MRNQYRQDRNQNQGRERGEESSYRRKGEQRPGTPENDWYDRDPMDERSGYRDEERNYSSRLDSSDLRGFNDHYRYDQNYHNYYGSGDYNPDRERGFESEGRRARRGDASYDSERYSRGQGAYGTTSSGQASWDTNFNAESNRYGRNTGERYGRPYSNQGEHQNQNYGSGSDRTSTSSTYGATQGSWTPSGEESRSSFYGRGPKGFKRSDERIKEEVCEALYRHHSIDADDIDVEVKDGEVILTGSVAERRMKHLAEDCAEQCFGVKDVVNNIRVKREESESGLRDRTSSSSTSSTSGKKSLNTSTDPKNPNH